MFVSCLLGANEERSARSAGSETHGKDWFILEQKVPKRTRANRKGTEVCPEMFFFSCLIFNFLPLYVFSFLFLSSVVPAVPQRSVHVGVKWNQSCPESKPAKSSLLSLRK